MNKQESENTYMVWVAVDFDYSEFIYYEKPYRLGMEWINNNDHYVRLPKGTVEKLIGKKLTWEDEPVELMDAENEHNNM